MAKSLKKWKILVTPREAAESLDSLNPQLLNDIELIPTHGRLNDSEKIISLLSDKDGAVLDLEPITSEVLKHCPNLRVISRFGEGCDAIDLESAKNSGVRVTRTRAISSQAVARHTMSLILAIMHHVTENDRNLKKGLWERIPNLSSEGATLGILGFGKIGKAVADLAKKFGFKVLIYSSRQTSTEYRYVRSLDELVGLSDILSIHLPLTSETKNIISKNIIQKLKGKYLVNTARGGLVDEDTLLKSLERNEVSGYATDVFSHEPISDISKKLVAHPKVICSPHIAALDTITNIKVTERAVKNALYCLNNEHGKVVSYVV